MYKDNAAREIDAALTTDRYELPREALASKEDLLAQVDTQGWLNLLWRRWNEVFQEKLGHLLEMAGTEGAEELGGGS